MRKKPIKIVISGIIFLFILAGIGAFTYYQNGIKSVSDKDRQVIFTVERGKTASSLLPDLEEAGLLKNITCAKIYLKLNDVSNIQANTYIFNENMSLEEIFSIMNHPTDEYVVKLQVTILDGYSLPDISASIASSLDMEPEEVLNFLNDETFLQSLIEDYWFITEDILQEGIKYPLEGYLYPETYTFFQGNSSLESVIRTSLDMMDTHLTPAKGLMEEKGWSAHEFLTFASVVERESLFNEDRPKIAGVFMNRLEINMLLQSDITVNYAWDRTGVDVSYAHLEIDSPYNTYKYPGLPIGPISSVSGVTIDSCINYEDNDYLFFFAKEDGTVIYSKTFGEHNNAAQTNRWY